MSRRRLALLSVSDKTGLADFAAALVRLGFEVISTGGTQKALADQGVKVTAVSEITGFPEILDGRVKTLHPRIHGGILADRSKETHLAQLQEHTIDPIEIVAVNLYPFARTVASPEATFAEAIEMIDIGGPSMVRSAAKNHAHVAVVVDPADYPTVIAQLETGELSEELRRRLAAKAFGHTAGYDTAIAGWLGARVPSQAADPLPERLQLALERELLPRYGENPHQPAAVYRAIGGPGVLGGMRQLQGKELSWNNLLDADAARKLVALFAEPTVAIIKHNNPCGVGRGKELAEAYGRALATDPVSAFGSIVALNRPADRAAAEAMRELFIEVLVAPGFDNGAAEVFAAKKNLRLLECPPYDPRPGEPELRAVDGGYLAQAPDAMRDDPAAWTCPTKRQPDAEERRALAFAWDVARYVKSNAIVLTNGDQTVGIGAGQMSRVDSCRIAIEKARLEVRGTVAASDAFFPFRDGLDVLAAAGVAAVVQPGGSKRDEEVVAAADEHGMAMLLTGTRHFRH
jgi:phosphoribosylaminoimidazolecarboxamide formyltransferase / IMP cyclohydrolase